MSPVRWLWNVLRRRIALRQEFDTHLALIEEDERAHGLGAEQARQNARTRFGNPLAHREQSGDVVAVPRIVPEIVPANSENRAPTAATAPRDPAPRPLR